MKTFGNENVKGAVVLGCLVTLGYVSMLPTLKYPLLESDNMEKIDRKMYLFIGHL